MIESLIFIVGLLTGGLIMYIYTRSSSKSILESHYNNLLKNKLLREELKRVPTTKGFNRKKKKKYYHGPKKKS